MDPVSLIVMALAAGASEAVKDTAAKAVTDAYGALKALLKRRLAKQPFAQDVLEKYADAPEVWEKPLAEELTKAGISEADKEIVSAAQQVLAAGKFNVTITGSKGVYVGDHGTVTMTFNDGD